MPDPKPDPRQALPENETRPASDGRSKFQSAFLRLCSVNCVHCLEPGDPAAPDFHPRRDISQKTVGKPKKKSSSPHHRADEQKESGFINPYLILIRWKRHLIIQDSHNRFKVRHDCS